MSGSSPPGPAPDALDLAALLCSRVCHDLISPVGAIVNGLEVLDDNEAGRSRIRPRSDPQERPQCIRAAAVLPPRLRRGGLGRRADRYRRRREDGRGFLEDDKTKIAWNLPRTLQPKNRVKLLLNMLMIAQQTIPRGGTLTVDPQARAMRQVSHRRTGLNARMPQTSPTARPGSSRLRSMLTLCSPTIRGCSHRPPASMWCWPLKAKRSSSPHPERLWPQVLTAGRIPLLRQLKTFPPQHG